MTDLGALVGVVEQAITDAETTLEATAASAGDVIGYPGEDVQGVYTAWEVHRRYWNGGAARHYDRINAAAAAFRRLP